MNSPVRRTLPFGVAGTQAPSDNRLSLYPHWLDSSYLTLVGLQNPEAHASIVNSVSRTLKLQAILGRRFVLSDPQAVDCPPLFELFGLRPFREFVSHTGFIRWRLRPLRDRPDIPLALTPLQRAVDANQFGTRLSDQKAALSFAGTLTSSKPLQDRERLLTSVANSADRAFLSGLVHVFAFFLEHAELVDEVDPETPRYSYLQMMERAISAKRTPDKSKEQLRKHVDFIMELKNPNAHWKRSALSEELSRRSDRWETEFGPLWSTVVNAWNCAAQRSVGHFGSIGSAWGGVPVGVYVDDVQDASSPFDEAEVIPADLDVKTVPICHISWDPADLGWDEIDSLLTNERIAGLQNQWIALARSSDRQGALEALREFSAELSARVAPRPTSKLTAPIVWVGECYAIKFGPRGKAAIRLISGLQKLTERWVGSNRRLSVAATIEAAGEAVLNSSSGEVVPPS
jgi:hypothetical protein